MALVGKSASIFGRSEIAGLKNVWLERGRTKESASCRNTGIGESLGLRSALAGAMRNLPGTCIDDF